MNDNFRISEGFGAKGTFSSGTCLLPMVWIMDEKKQHCSWCMKLICGCLLRFTQRYILPLKLNTVLKVLPFTTWFDLFLVKFGWAGWAAFGCQLLQDIFHRPALIFQQAKILKSILLLLLLLEKNRCHHFGTVTGGPAGSDLHYMAI